MAVPTIEERVTELAAKVSHLLEKESAKPWWERHFGAFKDNRRFDEAMRLGAEYRKAQPTPADSAMLQWEMAG